MSTKSHPDSTTSEPTRPAKRQRLESPIELTRGTPVSSTATPTPTSSPLPLNHANLELLDMATGLPQPSQAPASDSSSSGPSQTPAKIRQRLTVYQIMVRDKPYDAEEQINLLVKNMVLKPRGSPGMSKAEQDELAKLVDSLRNKDEGTASGILVNQLFPQPYSVGGGPKHLERIHITLFVDECLRRIMKTDDRAAQHARSAVGPLTNPKPDFTFGVAETIFETGHRLTSNSYSNLAGIQKGTLYPFFFVEWKSGATGGTQHSAQSQAARAGAALVHSILQLYAEALLGSASAPKLFNAAYSASFSATIDSDYLVLWVHWLDRSEGVAPGTYQMSVIEKYWLNDGENLWRLRKALKNIFEWGLEERVRNIKELLTDLGTKIQAAPLPASSSEISKSAKSSKSSKRQKT